MGSWETEVTVTAMAATKTKAPWMMTTEDPMRDSGEARPRSWMVAGKGRKSSWEKWNLEIMSSKLTRNDEALRPIFASFDVLSIRSTIENGIERLRVGCQFTRSVEIERFHGRYRWVEIYFHAASHIPYLYIGINTLRLIDLSDINHALRRMSNDGAQVRRMRRCFT